ncbi:DUF3964 family protein [Priestia filamentosa]|uniref:DUF3964 family protein n=1 Tax=Priestia filamentosa TaxID=1402861 RepID=UPI0005896BEA
MNTRQDKIMNSNFLKNREDLGRQLLTFENEGKGFLPNSPKYVEIPSSSIKFGDKAVVLGRIDKYYYFGIEVDKEEWKYKAFEDQGICNLFFHSIPGIDKQTLAFWLNQVQRLSDHF